MSTVYVLIFEFPDGCDLPDVEVYSTKQKARSAMVDWAIEMDDGHGLLGSTVEEKYDKINKRDDEDEFKYLDRTVTLIKRKIK